MSQHVVFLLLGLANGAVFASLALALVVTFRSSGVINFATGAIALFSAYVYAFLRKGELLVLVPGLPRSVDLGAEMGFAPAATISVALACALGLVLYGLTFRPLRAAPPVAKAVGSLGVMVVMTGVILQRMGTTPVQVAKIFPTDVYEAGSIRVSADRLWFACTVVGVALLLAAGYRFTRFGLHTRAAAETEKGAYVSGISPDRIAALNWMISCGVAGLAGILIAPISPLVPYSYTLFIVPALAAAIVGGFQRVGPAVAAGLAIGMLQSEATYLRTEHSWLPSSGLAELVPLALILLVLVVRAKPLPARGAVVRPNLGRAPRPTRVGLPAVVGTALGLVAIVSLHGSWPRALVTSFIFGIISLSLVVVTGYAGQVSLAQLTLAGVGGFLVGTLGSDWGVPFPVAPLLAAVGATVLGVVVGLPALRIRGLPVAVVTLSLAVAVQALWFRNTDLVGSSGKNVEPPSLFDLDLGPGSGAAFPRVPFCVLVLLVFVFVAIGVAKLRMSRLGSAMLAVRANERSAAASGIDVVRTKLAAFAIGAFVAGLGGSLLGYKLGNVTWDSFDVVLGLGVFATVYLAGITSVSGGVLAGVMGFGGLLYYGSTQWLAFDEYWYQIVTGIGLVLSVVMNPEGIVGPINRALGRSKHEPGRPSEVPAPRTMVAPLTVPDGVASARALLSIEGIDVRYGGVLAVSDVSFDVPERSIVGLIGPNGAGKTTLVDAISGFCPHAGSVRLAGVALDGRPPFRRIRAGLGRTFQGLELWNDLTVEENIVVGHGARRRSARELDEMFALLELGQVRDRLAGELSQGQRQLVSIARSLVSAPSVLLLDEPAAGLDPTESGWLSERLRDVHSGVTIVLIDHDMNLVLNLCDRIEVLNFGRLIASGSPDEIRSDRMVLEAYLGSSRATQEVQGLMATAYALECRDLDAGYGSLTIVRGLDMRLQPGTVLCVLGPNGAGKTTLLLTLSGLLPRLAGDVLVDGHTIPSFNPVAAGRAGLVLVPDDRALFTTLSVEENLRAAHPRGRAPYDDVADLFPALRKRWKVAAGSLSGGEQQMLAMARALVRRPRVLLVDEMSMGLAPIIVEQLMPLVRRIANETGAVVVLVEQHAQLALELADEAIVLAHRQAVLAGTAADLAADTARLEAAYMGTML